MPEATPPNGADPDKAPPPPHATEAHAAEPASVEAPGADPATPTEPTSPEMVATAPPPARAMPTPPQPPRRREPPPPPARAGRSAAPVLTSLGFLLLLAGLAYTWWNQQQLAERVGEIALQPSPPAADASRVAGLQAAVQALDQRVTTLQQHPAPAAPAGLGPLEQRVAALEKRPEPAAATAPPADLGPLEARVAALETRPDTAPAAAPVDLAPLQARIAALEGQIHEVQAANASALAPLTGKLDSSAADIAGVKAGLSKLAARLDEMAGQLKDVAQKQAALTLRETQLQRVGQAEVALDAGEPIGEFPDAPPALARFAHVKPPTEAALRLAFPAAADAAEAASKPSVEGKSLGERMWLRARSLVRVQQGDKVLVGPPSSAVLGEAHEKLEAGDLAGAVAALAGLDPAAAAAMAGWKDQAQALLDARAALAMTAKS